MRVRAILTGHREAMDSLRRLGKAGPKTIKTVLPSVTDRIVRRAQALCPRRTGRAARSIRATRGTAAASGRFSASVVAGGTPQTSYVERLHEDLTLRLRNGQHKFIEVPFLEEAERVPDELIREIDREARIAGR